jgi:hypothetical protein
MLFLNHTSYDSENSAPPVPSKSKVARMCHWNMWQRRMIPFNELSDGMRIVLVESWPRGGRLLWEIEATHVITERYLSKRAAIRVLQLTGQVLQLTGHTAIKFDTAHPRAGGLFWPEKSVAYPWYVQEAHQFVLSRVQGLAPRV